MSYLIDKIIQHVEMCLKHSVHDSSYDCTCEASIQKMLNSGKTMYQGGFHDGFMLAYNVVRNRQRRSRKHTKATSAYIATISDLDWEYKKQFPKGYEENKETN